MAERLVRLSELKEKTGLSRSGIYNKIKTDPSFPKKVKLGERCIAFVESEVDQWIDHVISESRSTSEVL